MPILDPYRLVHPLVLVLDRAGGPLKSAKAADLVADALNLSAAERAQRIPSGLAVTYRHRTGWAQHVAKRAKLTSAPRRGEWAITDAGRAWAKEFANGLPDSELRRLRAMNSRAAGAKPPPTTPDPGGEADDTPEERIDQALEELNQQVAEDLLEDIGKSSPLFFEKLVLDLLLAMGYGANRESIQHMGGSGDGGIDGIISLDRLGLEKVCIQAKRWQGTVGSPEIQKFVGALQLRDANKGVFITTSGFTRDAQETAKKAGGRVVLINGERLAALMIEHRVGVTPKRTLTISEMDSDYFDEL